MFALNISHKIIFYVYKCEGGCLKRAHLANTHSQGVFQGFSQGFRNMSLPGVEPVLPIWKVGVVTASPSSRTFVCGTSH